MKLYIVPTPIGNLEDMTYRAVKVLKEVDFILAEDTRTTGFMLKHFNIENRLMAHHKFNEHQSVAGVIALLKQGKIGAVVSDAGTPGLSDPGFLIVRECAANGIEVECLPGATAAIPALVNSGLPMDRFCFEGFFPTKKGRQTRLQQLQQECRTMVLYESPYRVIKTLEQLSQVLGAERQAVVSREISKIHAQTIRGSLAELIEYFTQNEPKGEFVLVVAGK